MKKSFVTGIKAGENVEDFFMIKQALIKSASNGNKYIDMIVHDKSGEVGAKFWDYAEGSELNIKEGQIIKIRGSVSEWNGSRQIKILKYRLVEERDDIKLMDFIKTAPEEADQMIDYIIKQAESIEDIQLKALCLKILNDNKERLLYYPAAMKNHHSEMAGLLYHVKRMLELAINASLVYKNLKRDWLVTGVIIHDIAKIYEIESNSYGVASSYTFEGLMLGHIVQGIKMIEKIAEEQGIDNEKSIMLQHMILSHHYEPDFGSPKRPMFPEAEMLHYLDMIDARMYDMEDALKETALGEFSEKVWTLHNRKLYKPKEEK